MKKISTLLFLFLFAILPAATAGEIRLGYCNDQVTLHSDVGTTGRAWVEAAILLPGNVISSYGGNQLTHVRVGLASSLNVDTLTVWLRTALDGDNIAEGTITRSDIKRGWNDVALAAPYNIGSEDGDIYVGYSFKQRGTVNAVSYVDGATANAFYVKLGEDANWQDNSAIGALCLEATIAGDNIYTHDVGILNQAARMTSNSNSVTVSATLKNFGSEPVQDIALTISSAGLGAQSSSHISMALTPGEARDTTITFESLPAGMAFVSDARIAIDEVNGMTDENPSNDHLSLPFAHERKVLIEEFTSEGCVNCPRLAKTLHDLMEQPDYEEKIIAVCHHDGFSHDWLTRPEDAEYLWFYNSTTTYAPALMIDRYPFMNNNEGRLCPVFDPTAEDLKAGVDYRLAEPTYTSISIAANLVTDDSLHVQVSGFRARPFGSTPTRLTLFLVEDSITARKQVGASAGYQHMHVERDINSAWGVPVEWQPDGTFSYDYGIRLSDNWRRDQLSVIAAIGDYDPDNLNNCIVENAEQLRLSQILSTGIHTAATSPSDTAPRYYTLDGRALSKPLSKGVTIMRQGGKSRKIFRN